MSEDRKESQRGIERQPGQTDEAWAKEVAAFLEANEKLRPKTPRVIETHAKSSSWQRKPFDETVEIRYEDRFTPEEFEKLKRGLIPAAMEDKWFIYFEEGQLFLHRSWTGNGVYRVILRQEEDGGGEVVSAHYATEFREDSELSYGAALLAFLIGNLLLDRGLPFPKPAGIKEPLPGVFQHGMTGTGYPEETPDKE